MLNQNDQAIVNQAISIISNSYKREDLQATSPYLVKQFCQLQIANLDHEVFGVLLLDSQHRLIEFIKLFRGTINAASVYPREVVKEALIKNAAAVIFTHNHPSGAVDPSDSDKVLTTRLVSALGLLDIRVLDHVIVSKVGAFSFGEMGLL